MEQLLERLFIVDDYQRHITEMIDNEIIDYGRTILLIFNQAQKSSSLIKLDELSRLLAEICVKEQSLKYVEDKMNLVFNEESNSTCKVFMRKCFRDIGE